VAEFEQLALDALVSPAVDEDQVETRSDMDDHRDQATMPSQNGARRD
jgi:hypothetical protein